MVALGNRFGFPKMQSEALTTRPFHIEFYNPQAIFFHAFNRDFAHLGASTARLVEIECILLRPTTRKKYIPYIKSS